jgi:hypothetical protein
MVIRPGLYDTAEAQANDTPTVIVIRSLPPSTILKRSAKM